MNPSVSPDGAIRVDYSPNEAGPSRWVFSPRVTHVPTGDVLLDLWDPVHWRWDGSAAFEAPATVSLTLRRYPDGMHSLVVTIDADQRTYVITGDVDVDEIRGALGEVLVRA
jgi:hypothetical protein